MKRKAIIALSTGLLLAGGAALAGINPASPGLPNVTDAVFATQPIANNQASAMCVDCHTVNPKGLAGTGSHYVNVSLVATNGATNSGGSGINSAGTEGASRDNGAYFKLTLWNASGARGASFPSKYALQETSYVNTAPVVNSVALAAGKFNATVQATAATFANYDIICESCHNIVGNDDGGNNLLENQGNGNMATNNYQAPAIAGLCVGCHGFMYSNAAATWTATVANCVNDTDARNNNEVAGSGQKGNNEYHWVRGTAYPVNHHVMSGDAINGAMAAAAALWTDNLLVSYSDVPIDSGSTKATYPQKATWSGPGMAKPSTGTNPAVNCTNCHTPAHGHSGSPGASILRGGAYTTTPAASTEGISRISDRAAWKRIKDLDYCNQCHR